MYKFLRNIKPNKDDGNAFLMYIFIFPILCGAVGLSLDASMGNYTRTGLQNAADNAVVAGAAQTKYSGKKKAIDFDRASETVNSVYREQRQQYGNLSGSTPKITVKLIVGRGGAPDSLQVNIQEESPTIFLHTVGVSEFKYDIQSQARLGYIVE